MKLNHITKKLLGVGLLAFAFFTTQAQTTIFNQQWYSRVNRNPAAAASGIENINLGLFYRNQWTGVDGAPTTALMNADMYVDKIKSGFGLTIAYDQLGKSTSSFDIMASYAYRLKFDNWQLSLGLAGGLMNNSKDPMKDNFGDNTDPNIPTSKVNSLNPDFNLGAELSYSNLTAGFAVDHLLYSDPGTSNDFRTPREFYTYGRYNIQLPSDFELAPQLGWYYFNFNHDNVFEIGATATYKKLVWLGVDYMTNNALSFMAGVEFSGVQLGYAYQMSTGNTSQIAKSTHELMLRIKIDYKNAQHTN